MPTRRRDADTRFSAARLSVDRHPTRREPVSRDPSPSPLPPIRFGAAIEDSKQRFDACRRVDLALRRPIWT